MSIMIMAVIPNNLGKVKTITLRLSKSRADEDGKGRVPWTQRDECNRGKRAVLHCGEPEV
jgi:hypothetical protein